MDKHGLAPGQHWRRVYEVTGGGWQPAGAAWTTTAFAYHLSIACNHCEQPICAEVCPSGAMRVRPDGIVLVEAECCLGCNYCRWACPYDAPQLDWRTGVMTKCTFCAEELAQGLPPACVAACGVRALDYGERAELQARYAGAPEVFPLPEAHLTEPGLVIRPHQAALQAKAQGGNMVKRLAAEKGSGSLVAFTLLAQSGVGMFAGGTLLALALPYQAGFAPTGQVVAPVFLTGLILFGSGLLASLLHLGYPRNAWRALGNLRTSWLSREILLSGLFGVSGALAAGAWLFQAGSSSLRVALSGAAAIIGLSLVYAMARVYRLRTISAWDRPSTPLAFFRATLLLGMLLAVVVALRHPALAAYREAYLPAIVTGGIALFFEARRRARFYTNRG